MRIKDLLSEERAAVPPKPRNFVAKNAKMGGAGQHKDKKKAEKQGDVKHKKELATMESAPDGWEGTVKAMKKHKDIDNPYALAWSMKNKGYKSHKKEAFQNDEANMMYRFNPDTGLLGQRMIHNDEESVAHQHGYRDSHEDALRVHNIIRSKFDPKKFVQKQGGKWVPVYPYGQKNEDVDEGAMSELDIEIGDMLDGYIAKYQDGLLDADHLGAMIDKAAARLSQQHHTDQNEMARHVSNYVADAVGEE
jgi:hypothetical protein